MAELNFDDLVPTSPQDLSFDDLTPKKRSLVDMVREIFDPPAPQSDIPEGMVFDPNTGSYTSRELMANTMQPSATEAAVAGGAMGSSLGWVDELYGMIPGQGEFLKEKARAAYDASQRDRPATTAAGEIGSAVTGAAGLGKAGVTLMRSGMSLPALMGTGAIEGAGYGAIAGAGHADEGDRLRGAGTGAALGGAAGGALPGVLAAGGTALKTVGGMAGIGNQGRAKAAIAETLARSGRSLDDVTDDLARAARDGQDEYALVDAMGNSGQRMLSGVVRSPGDARQKVVETLQRRQAGQTDRLVNALAEGFDAPDTAAQRIANLKAVRKSQADTNYMLARDGAGAVDPTAAIAQADDFLQPGVMPKLAPQNSIADDSVEAAVRRARSYLTDGNSVLSDFDSAFRAKVELDNMIDRASPTIQRQIIPIRNALDDALEKSSPNYAEARNTYRAQSKAIDAVDVGTQAATRGRADDNIRAFSGMSPEEQASFRGGYADPLIRRVEAASMSPTTNKARMLITGKTGKEFPAFAAPGKADQLGDRIAREGRMFETANAALGGSKTADNLADIADLQAFDPTMLGAMGTGNFKGAILQALTKSGNVLEGRNQKTRDLIAQILLETDSSRAMQSLATSVRRGEALSTSQKALVRALSAEAGANSPF